VELNLPTFEAKIKEDGGKAKIFDILRRKYVALTPEEWVRQHFVHYLVEHLGYPQSLLANEVNIRVGSTSKRCDTVLYGRDLKPLLVAEYKSPQVKITQDVFDQITRYNMRLHVSYLVVSNGLEHYCCRVDYPARTYHFLESIPAYAELASGDGHVDQVVE